jgi:hypothetical protein
MSQTMTGESPSVIPQSGIALTRGSVRPLKMPAFVQTRNNYCQDDFSMFFVYHYKRLPPSQ